MYIVIGDSHVRILKHSYGFKSFYIGAATAFNLCNPKSTTQSYQRLLKALEKTKEDDVIVLSFGEIDCRIHVYDQSCRREVPISSIIDNTISNYFKVLTELRENGYKICVLGIPACGSQGNRYRAKYYPIPKVQASIYKEFNEKMSDRCKKEKYFYIDVFNWSRDEDGFMQKEYKKDVVHLNNKVIPFIEEQLNKRK